jgi:hypothetical protein
MRLVRFELTFRDVGNVLFENIYSFPVALT